MLSARGLNRGWRVLATGLCFATFGVGCLLLTCIAAPILGLFVRSAKARKRHAQRLMSKGCRTFLTIMDYSGVLDYHITGEQHLRQQGRLIVANHPSLIDVILIMAFTPEVDCVVNEKLWRNPFTAGPIRLAGYVSNGTGPELVARCCQSLEAGHGLIIFPEGTRTRPGQPLHFQRGAANVAVHADVDIVPVTIIFDQTTLTKGEPWYHVPREKATISISVEPPISVRQYLDNNTSQPLAARRLTTDLYDYYTDRLARAGRLPEDEPIRHSAQR